MNIGLDDGCELSNIGGGGGNFGGSDLGLVKFVLGIEVSLSRWLNLWSRIEDGVKCVFIIGRASEVDALGDDGCSLDRVALGSSFELPLDSGTGEEYQA